MAHLNSLCLFQFNSHSNQSLESQGASHRCCQKCGFTCRSYRHIVQSEMSLLYLLLLVASVSTGTGVDCCFCWRPRWWQQWQWKWQGFELLWCDNIKYCRGNKSNKLVVWSQFSIISSQIKSHMSLAYFISYCAIWLCSWRSSFRRLLLLLFEL